MPIDGEVRFLLLSTSCKVYLCQFPGVNDLAIDREFLFKDTKLSKTLRVVESD